MRLNRLIRVRVIAITLFALLFAQLSVAAYACPYLTAMPAGAEMPAGCPGMTSRLDPASPNLCAEHCQDDDQGDQPRTPAAPEVSLVSLYVVPSMSASLEPSRPAIESFSLLAARPPPHTILHCCFRI